MTPDEIDKRAVARTRAYVRKLLDDAGDDLATAEGMVVDSVSKALSVLSKRSAGEEVRLTRKFIFDAARDDDERRRWLARWPADWASRAPSVPTR